MWEKRWQNLWGVIKKFVGCGDKIETMLDGTFKICIFSYKAILHMIANNQLSWASGIKNRDCLVVHVFETDATLN